MYHLLCLTVEQKETHKGLKYTIRMFCDGLYFFTKKDHSFNDLAETFIQSTIEVIKVNFRKFIQWL